MPRSDAIKLRHKRIRKRVAGNPSRPRLCVHFSGQHIYAQIVDDTIGKTLAAASTVEPAFRGTRRTHANVATAEKVGALLAQRGLERNVKSVVFDRGGFAFHGKVKALAEAARAGGLEF
ncbi:MAG: 50S ribosomal protein L18 [Chthoniobacterales bacterium]|jgi:large subunit ribosomal protein L18